MAVKYRTLLTLPLLLLIMVSNLAIATTKQSTTLPDKAISDSNSYYFITLKNGLPVILVSDPQAERFSAAMAVHVGSYQDPKDQQGLAHLLEHMLFLGTQKYPKPGEYQTFINNHGGNYNAYTTITNTNYYFDVQPDAYENAIDRFSQFFIAPLINRAFTKRERHAVDAEYKAKLTSESRRLDEAFKTLFNPSHPQSHFSIGNLRTLEDRPNRPLHQQLIKLYKANYVASNMALVLVANLPYEKLSNIAKRYFSAIPTGKTPKRTSLPVLIQNNQNQLQFFKSAVDNSTLSICYQIDAQEPFYKTHPSQYVSYILGNEGKNSLYSSLKNQGLINNLSVTLLPDYGKNALLCTKMLLTDKGIKNLDDIAKAFFATIDVIKSSPVNSAYLKEAQTLSKLSYYYHSYIAPQNLAKILATRMLTTQASDVLSSFTIKQTASTDQINEVLDQLNDHNLLVQLSTPTNFPTSWAKKPIKWKTEPWYHSRYSNNKLSDKFVAITQLAAKNTHITLPEENHFLPESMKLVDGHNNQPYIVYQKPYFTFWNKTDTSFKKPNAINFLAIRFDHAADSPKHTVLNHLWTRLFNDNISDATYAPFMAGLGYSLYPHINGITINTNGYSDKQDEYLIWLVDKFFLYRPNKEDFERIKAQLKKDLDNQKGRQAYQAADMALSTLITQNNYTNKELLEALRQVRFQDLESFILAAINQFDVIGYSTGNITKSSTVELAKTLRKRFVNRLGEHTPANINTKALFPKERLTYQFQSTSTDNTVLYSLIDTAPLNTNKSEKETSLQKSYFSILCTLLNSRFYYEFRTVKQFGYIVAAQDLSTRNTPILGLLIQSPNTNSITLIRDIEAFLNKQAIALQQLSDKDFQNAKNTLLSNLGNSARNLGDNAYNEWHQVVQPSPNFDETNDTIRIVKGITKEDFIRYISNKIEEGNSARILVHNKTLGDHFLQQDGWTRATPEGNQLLAH